MSEVEARIREILSESLLRKQEGSSRFRKFASDSDFELAVSLIRKRYESLVKMSKELSRYEDLSGVSVDQVIAYVSERKSRRLQRNFPQNEVPLSSFIPPSSVTGLCPLPSRVDCLTAPCTIHPEYVSESDLSFFEVQKEEVALDERPGDSSRDHATAFKVGNMKKVRIRNI